MAPRGSRPQQIGATQAPEFASEELKSVQLAGLDARFELEDVRVCSASLLEVDAGSGRLGRVHLKDIYLGESKLRAVDFVDVIAERIDAANGDWGGAQLRRTLFNDARLTGLSFAEARIQEVSFEACKLDYANFRHSEIERVSFEDCVLTGADFQGASIKATASSWKPTSPKQPCHSSTCEAQTSGPRDRYWGFVARSSTHYNSWSSPEPSRNSSG